MSSAAGTLAARTPSSFCALMNHCCSRGGKRSSSTFMPFSSRLTAASWSCESRIWKACGSPASRECARNMRLHRPWKVPIHMPRGFTGSIAVTRVSISRAALLVNVTASTPPGVTLSLFTSQAMRVVRTRVLPLPAPARISACSSGSVTAASCSGLRCSRCSDTKAQILLRRRALPACLRRAFRIRPAVLAAELLGKRVRLGFRRQAADAHDVEALLALQSRGDLGAVARRTHLVVHVERRILVVSRDERHLPFAGAARRALALLDLGFLRPFGELRFIDEADRLGRALLATVELARLVHGHRRLVGRADLDLAFDQADGLAVGGGFAP